MGQIYLFLRWTYLRESKRWLIHKLPLFLINEMLQIMLFSIANSFFSNFFSAFQIVKQKSALSSHDFKHLPLTSRIYLVTHNIEFWGSVATTLERQGVSQSTNRGQINRRLKNGIPLLLLAMALRQDLN